MPVVNILAHGVSVGTPPSNNNHDRAKRGKLTGWSAQATRNNTRWLQSVDHESLTGQGFAATLTMKGCPIDAREWADVRKAYFQRLKRAGMVRMHWVVEWQRRRVPHLHCAIWFDKNSGIEDPEGEIQRHWLSVTSCFGSADRAQSVVPIHEFGGWAKYVSKHASRGMHHYQRCAEAQPKGWESPGRVWGHLGHWTQTEAIKLTVSAVSGYRMRRILRKLRIKDAQRFNDGRRVSQARRMLKSNCSRQSQIRGMSDWMDRDIALDIVAWIMREDPSVSEFQTRRQRQYERLNATHKTDTATVTKYTNCGCSACNSNRYRR